MSCNAALIACFLATTVMALFGAWLIIRHSFYNGLTAIAGLAGFVCVPILMSLLLWQVLRISSVWDGLAACSGDAKRLVADMTDPATGPLLVLVMMIPLFFVSFAVVKFVDWLWNKTGFQSEEP